MKKLICLMMILGVNFISNACTLNSNEPNNLQEEQPDEPAPAPDFMGRILVVYYSFTNNVHTIANDLRTQMNADVISVEPAEEGIDYASNNYAIGSNLIAAIRENPDKSASYPAIKTTIDNLADYSTIIIVTPLWWSNMAAPMQTFLFKYGSQMSEKSIGLVVSSSSSGIGGVESDARRLISGGKFLASSLWIRSAQTSNCHSMITEWLTEIGHNATNSTGN